MSERDFKVVSVEGLIGCGKSTILEVVKNYEPFVEVHFEPVDKFCDVNGENLLQLMYEKPKKWGSSFQNHVLNSLLPTHLDPPEDPKAKLKVVERSIHSSRFVFMEAFLENGHLSPIEYQILRDRYELIVKLQPNVKLDHIIYAKCSPGKSIERVAKRGRVEEKNLTLSYLKGLERLHDSWLLRNPDQSLIILNAEAKEAEVKRAVNEIIINLLCDSE